VHIQYQSRLAATFIGGTGAEFPDREWIGPDSQIWHEVAMKRNPMGRARLQRGQIPRSNPREISARQSKERKTQKLEPLVIGRKNQAGLPTARP
jgi:hypothetical protein